jgi:pyrimidine operon attenuation protein/uracil phosphoribosyltransferase
MAEKKEKLILDVAQLAKTLEDLARRIAAAEAGGDLFSLIGIQTRGVPLAQRLAALLPGPSREIGVLDINLYRDDLSTVAEFPIVKSTVIPFSLQGRRVLLVDDVLYTGRTVRSALDAIMDLGRPKKLELLALVDRGGRELPIQADFCGKTCDVRLDEVVKVRLKETDGKDEVVIAKL